MCGATMSVEGLAHDAAPQKARKLALAGVFHIRWREKEYPGTLSFVERNPCRSHGAIARNWI